MIMDDNKPIVISKNSLVFPYFPRGCCVPNLMLKGWFLLVDKAHGNYSYSISCCIYHKFWLLVYKPHEYYSFFHKFSISFISAIVSIVLSATSKAKLIDWGAASCNHHWAVETKSRNLIPLYSTGWFFFSGFLYWVVIIPFFCWVLFYHLYNYQPTEVLNTAQLFGGVLWKWPGLSAPRSSDGQEIWYLEGFWSMVSSSPSRIGDLGMIQEKFLVGSTTSPETS